MCALVFSAFSTTLFSPHRTGNAILNNGTTYYHTYFNNDAQPSSLVNIGTDNTQTLFIKQDKEEEEENPRFNFSVNCAFLFILFASFYS